MARTPSKPAPQQSGNQSPPQQQQAQSTPPAPQQQGQTIFRDWAAI